MPSNVRSHVLVERGRQSDAVHRRSDCHVHVVDDQRTIDGDRQRLRAFLEFPAYAPEEPIEMSMHRWRVKSRGDSGFGCDLKYCGEATMAARWSRDTRAAIMSRSINSPQMNPGIESRGGEDVQIVELHGEGDLHPYADVTDFSTPRSTAKL